MRARNNKNIKAAAKKPKNNFKKKYLKRWTSENKNYSIDRKEVDTSFNDEKKRNEYYDRLCFLYKNNNPDRKIINQDNEQINDLTNFHDKIKLVNKVLCKHNRLWKEQIFYDYKKDNFVYTEGKSLFVSKLTEKEKNYFGSKNILLNKLGEKTEDTFFPNYKRVNTPKTDNDNVVIDWHKLSGRIKLIIEVKKEEYKQQNNNSLRGFKDEIQYCRIKIVDKKLIVNPSSKELKQRNSERKYSNLYNLEKLVNCMILFRENENNFTVFNWNKNDGNPILLENDNIKLFFMPVV